MCLSTSRLSRTPPATPVNPFATSLLPTSTSHPHAILSCILDELSSPSSRHFRRYGNFVPRNRGALEELLRNSLRPDVVSLAENRKTGYIKDVVALGGDLRYRGRGVYLHVVQFKNDNSRARYYVGQAYNVSFRLWEQHNDFRYRRDNPSYHNYAVDRSSKDNFILLATVSQHVARPDLSSNIMEMWTALIFQTLSDDALRSWLGAPTLQASQIGIYGLNIALPLDNGLGSESRAAFTALEHARDPMARQYWWDTLKGNVRARAPPRNVNTLVGSAAVPVEVVNYFSCGCIAGGIMVFIYLKMTGRLRSMR